VSSRELFIGLMSGTSLDGVDAVLAEFGGGRPRTVAASHLPYDDVLRAELLQLHATGSDELHRAALLANRLSDRYADAVAEVLLAGRAAPSDIAAIGCHGQTVRHRPELGYSLQLVSGARLAESAGITVVTDFRNRDIAAGGQGAPLVPAFHQAMFARPARRLVIANIGGIANLTRLAPGEPVIGFDCGPGNMLMDAWIMKSRGERLDRDGTWAAGAKVLPELLAALLREPYLDLAPPKSTGRELFNAEWLAGMVGGGDDAADVQRTLLEYTAETMARAIDTFCQGTQEVLLCGGGARNRTLHARLSERLHPAEVRVSDEVGIAAEHVEALAFAWLARRTLRGETGSLPDVTGAREPRVLGAIYPF
jgi:anhydro-N-acetylmuramic acid kinase